MERLIVVHHEFFEEELIRELYSIDNGFFDPLFGSIELPKPGKKNVGQEAAQRKDKENAAGEQEAKTLVLSSCGSGIPVYRRLQKENVPFIAGVLYKNDMDYRLARLLADRVITEEPFEELSGRAIEEALEAVEACDRVIDAGVVIGTANRGMEKILAAARAAGKLETIS